MSFVDIQIVETPVGGVVTKLPDWIDHETFARAVEACARGSSLRPVDRTMTIGLHGALAALGLDIATWPEAASERLLAEINSAVEAAKLWAMTPECVDKAAALAVGTLCKMLVPVHWSTVRFAPVAVLLGPRLQGLRVAHSATQSELIADWGTEQRTAPLYGHTPGDEMTSLARALRMTEKNGHVGRIVHWPGWEHAEAVRRRATLFSNLNVVAVDVGVWEPHEVEDVDPNSVVPVVRMRRHARVCRRCDRDRAVWAPAGFVPRPCDFGACPRCDRWAGPTISSGRAIAGGGFDSEALRLGETVAWHELSDRSILEIARYEASYSQLASRRDLGFALAEAAYRNLLPTTDELLVAWDLAQAKGWAAPDAHDLLTLVDVWALFVPRLRALAQD